MYWVLLPGDKALRPRSIPHLGLIVRLHIDHFPTKVFPAHTHSYLGKDPTCTRPEKGTETTQQDTLKSYFGIGRQREQVGRSVGWRGAGGSMGKQASVKSLPSF